MAKKITQNINKDAGLMDLPKVRVPRSKWKTEHSNYLTCDIGDIVPIYVDEVLPSEKRKVTMGMLSHMTTPIAPIFNAQYTEFRSFFVPYRLCADLLNGYSTRKSLWVKVFGEDPSASNAQIIVPLANQVLPQIASAVATDVKNNLSAFGGLLDSLDYDNNTQATFFTYANWLDVAAYELIYQYKYRNENREAATNSDLYKWCFNVYNRANANTINFQNCDKFHKANREKDYFTGAQPFTQKSSSPVTAGLTGSAPVGFVADSVDSSQYLNASTGTGATVIQGFNQLSVVKDSDGVIYNNKKIVADLSSAGGIDINSLRLMIKTQELLEKDMMYGSKYSESLNAHFGTCPISLVVEEPLELKKVTITSQMQPIFQTSTTANEQTILGTIGANATTQSGDFEIVPETEFKEYGLLIVCAVHKAQNSYDSLIYHPKRIFKRARFDFYTPELNDLGFQPVQNIEFDPNQRQGNILAAVGYNEAYAEYRYKYNRVHGMFEPNRSGAKDFWTLAMGSYSDIQSIYKQGVTELNRAISFDNTVVPQFFDAYGFIEINDKPMSLHSIPGMDGVI